MEKKPFRILVVDDSALMRQMLSQMLSSDPALEVVDTAEDPFVAREKIKRLNPDVVTLDVEMPRMHGIDFLEKIMTLRPMPVVMISSLTTEGAQVTLRALELGAVDFVAKPAGPQDSFWKQQEEIVTKVKTAARARVRPLQGQKAPEKPFAGEYRSNGRVVAIGASTGGVEALGKLLTMMPASGPPILVAQHMPERFVPHFAERLNGICEISVVEARDGQHIEAGHAYIAPGNLHLTIGRSGNGYCCRLRSGERVSGHCPSVDVLFQSFAKIVGANGVGVILTGMGRDGAAGLKAMREAGARTIGQDESSSLVYGMPRAAFEIGAVEEQLPLSRVTSRVLKLCMAEPVGS